MGDILPNLIAALRLGELMMEEELTWQAVGMYVVFLALGGRSDCVGNGEGSQGVA